MIGFISDPTTGMVISDGDCCANGDGTEDLGLGIRSFVLVVSSQLSSTLDFMRNFDLRKRDVQSMKDYARLTNIWF